MQDCSKPSAARRLFHCPHFVCAFCGFGVGLCAVDMGMLQASIQSCNASDFGAVEGGQPPMVVHITQEVWRSLMQELWGLPACKCKPSCMWLVLAYCSFAVAHIVLGQSEAGDSSNLMTALVHGSRRGLQQRELELRRLYGDYRTTDPLGADPIWGTLKLAFRCMVVSFSSSRDSYGVDIISKAFNVIFCNTFVALFSCRGAHTKGVGDMLFVR